MSTSNFCPACGRKLDPNIAGGNCPHCLLKQVAENGDSHFQTDPGVWNPPPLEAIAAAFPQWEVLELIGRGGMGAVYKVRQRTLDRIVALKILAPVHATKSDFANRFTREAQLLAGLNHPNIVAVHDFGKSGEFYFLLMEFVDGVNLRQAMNAARLTPEQALRIVPPVCEALQYAHERSIVHRDIKPENLLLDKQGRIKIADFGIARMMRDLNGSNQTSSQLAESPETNSLNQATTNVVGTPRYMAPEQLLDPISVDHRADIYSLGVVLYEMLTGETPASTIQPPSTKVQIDVRLDDVVLRALSSEAELRYASATEFQTSIETFSNSLSSEAGAASASINAPPPNVESSSTYNNFLRVEQCIVTTPDVLETSFGQFFLWRCSTRVIMDDRSLNFDQRSTRSTINFKDIREIIVRPFPVMVNPYGLCYISLIYHQMGANLELVIAPNSLKFGLPVQFNEQVLEWAEDLQRRVKTAQSKTDDILQLRLAEGKAHFGSFVVFVSVISFFVAIPTFIFQSLLGASWLGLLAIPAIFVPIIITVSTAIAFVRRSSFKAISEAKSIAAYRAVAPRQASMQLLTILGSIFGIFAIAFIVMMYLLRNNANQFYPPVVPTFVPAKPIDVAPMIVPTASLSQSNDATMLRIHRLGLDYIVYYHGIFTHQSRSGSNRASALWHEDYSMLMSNGRTFQVFRDSVNPGQLRINGNEYELKEGQLFELLDDGTVKQFKFDKSSETVETIEHVKKYLEAATPVH